MIRWIQRIGLTMACTLALSLSTVRAGEQAVARCPIMGEPVNLSVSTPTDDGPVFFCCKGCIKKYTANPGKYADAVAKQRKALAKRPKVQTTCPISGKPVDKKVFTEYNGKKVYFCCEDCISRFNEAPDKHKKALANSYTYQTKCPVMGGSINPKSFSILPTGEKIYYCCPGCENKLLADPAKYAPKLAAQGIVIDVNKLKEKAAPGHEGHDHSGHGDHDGH